MGYVRGFPPPGVIGSIVTGEAPICLDYAPIPHAASSAEGGGLRPDAARDQAPERQGERDGGYVLSPGFVLRNGSADQRQTRLRKLLPITVDPTCLPSE